MKSTIIYCLCALTACSLIGLFSFVSWFFDLFNQFRMQAVLASIIVCVAALLFDRKRLPFALVLFVINGIFLVMPIYQTRGVSHRASNDGDAKKVKIIASNVYTPNNQFQKAVDVITNENPDIIAFTETDERWINNLHSLRATYIHTIKHPRSDNFGMAIYSKLPFQAKILDIGEYALPLAVLDFEDFRLIVAHPIPPVSAKNAAENKIYMQAIAQNIGNTNKPVIVAGDMNNTIWANAVKPLFDAGLKRINPFGIAYTWPTPMPLFAMQIDHFFARGITEADFKVLSDIGSDHYPIETVIHLQ